MRIATANLGIRVFPPIFDILRSKMASTPKKTRLETNSVTGFLQSISPLKTSKNNRKYFNAILQTKTGYEPVVSFKPEAHRTFEEMAFAK